jgi:hypothetical protein
MFDAPLAWISMDNEIICIISAVDSALDRRVSINTISYLYDTHTHTHTHTHLYIYI